MQIIHHMTIDMAKPLPVVPVSAVQGDGNTRILRLTLLENGEPWAVPQGVTAAVAFRKSDGTKGLYDTLPDGTKAITMDGSTVSAVLAPQALSCPGEVSAAVAFYDSKLSQLATFPFTVKVARNPSAGQAVSNDYYRYSTMEAVSEAVEAALNALETAKQDFLQTAGEALAAVQDTAAEDAPAIVCEASGERISVADASGKPLKGLTLYGKTLQNGTPTPETPVPLESVGAGGAIKTTVGSTNLCNPNMFNNAAYYTVGEDGYITFANTKTDKMYYNMSFPVPKGTYTAKVECSGDIEVYVCKDTMDYSNQILQAKTIILAGVTNRVHIMACVNGNVTRKIRFTVNAGSESLPYEPYKGQTLTASTPNGLPGIPVESGGNYTDENGQQWLCDEVDFGRGVYVKRVYQQAVTISHMAKKQKTNHVAYNYLADYATRASQSGLCSVMGQNQYQYGGNDNRSDESWYIDQGIWLFILNENVSAFEAKETVTVLYDMRTPIETPLSAEELAQYAALHTNKPNTTVFNDSGAGVKLSYVADTKTYIDQKLAAISAAILG